VRTLAHCGRDDRAPRALLWRLGQYLDEFSTCLGRQPQRDAASQYLDACATTASGSPCRRCKAGGANWARIRRCSISSRIGRRGLSDQRAVRCGAGALVLGAWRRGDVTCAVVTGAQSARTIALSAPESAWNPYRGGTGSAKLLTARFCALRVQPRARRSVVALRTIAHRRARYYLLHLPARATVVRRVTSGRC
jgi:hypothetical protein